MAHSSRRGNCAPSPPRSRRRRTKRPRASPPSLSRAASWSANWADARKALALAGSSGASASAEAEPEQVNGVTFSHQILEGFDAKGLKALVDESKKSLGSGISTVISINEGRATIVVGVTEDLDSQARRGRSGEGGRCGAWRSGRRWPA